MQKGGPEADRAVGDRKSRQRGVQAYKTQWKLVPDRGQQRKTTGSLSPGRVTRILNKIEWKLVNQLRNKVVTSDDNPFDHCKLEGVLQETVIFWKRLGIQARQYHGSESVPRRSAQVA